MGIPALKTDHVGGKAVKQIRASDLNAIARFINDIEGGGCVVIRKTPTGAGSMITVTLSPTDFSVRPTDQAVQTRGYTGVVPDDKNIRVVNGLIKSYY